MDNVGRMQIGRLQRNEKKARQNAGRKAELHRDEARNKIMAIRMRLKRKVEKNERQTESRKKEREKSTNPVVVSFMPSRESAKRTRNAVATWSAVPAKPKYSRVTPKKRIYGKKRFEAIEAAGSRAGAINKPRRL